MELQSNSLSSNKKRPLQDWLNSPQANLLIELIEAKIFKLECESANEIADSSKGGVTREAMIERAAQKAAEIEMHRNTIKTLREIRDAETLVTYTATPTRE